MFNLIKNINGAQNGFINHISKLMNFNPLKKLDEFLKYKPILALFGDCQTQEIALSFNHTRAVGLTSWLALFSNFSQNFELFALNMQESKASNYAKRICKLNANKKFLDYLLEEKADYLILDCNDCRKRIIIEAGKKFSGLQCACITENPLMTDFKATLEKTLPKKYAFVDPSTIDINIFKEATEKTCACIKKIYDPQEIIIHKHFFAEHYIKDQHLCKYFLNTSTLARTIKLLQYIYSLLEEFLPGAHVIEFPENVLGNPDSRLGLHPLHYHPLYCDYARECLEIIFSKDKNETTLLRQKQIEYSFKFKSIILENEVALYGLFNTEKLNNFLICSQDEHKIKSHLLSIKFISLYLDFLNLIKKKYIIVVSTRDTPGFYNECNRTLEQIRNIGFINYPSQAWIMYSAVLFKGELVAEAIGKDGNERVCLEYGIGENKISIESSPVRNGNRSLVNVNGINVSCNARGINIAVLEAATCRLVDSIAYDSHLLLSEFFSRLPAAETRQA